MSPVHFADSSTWLRSPLELPMLLLLQSRLKERARQLRSTLQRRRAQSSGAVEPLAPLLAQAEAEWSCVDAALRRIDRGTYGLCHACGDAIPRDRLLADPCIGTCAGHGHGVGDAAAHGHRHSETA